MRVKSTANYFNCASQVGTLVTYANLHTSSTLTCFLFLTKSADHIPTVFFCVIKPVFILGFTKKSPLHLYCTSCMFSSQGYRSRTMALLSAALDQSADCVYPVGLVHKTTAAEQWRCYLLFTCLLSGRQVPPLPARQWCRGGTPAGGQLLLFTCLLVGRLALPLPALQWPCCLLLLTNQLIVFTCLLAGRQAPPLPARQWCRG